MSWSSSEPRSVRVATSSDVPALTALINEAFQVEAFFKIGDRTSTREIERLMKDGEFLVVGEDTSTLAGCVYFECRGERAYFGMLSIDPSQQKTGLGRLLIEAAEGRAKNAGCRFMDIHIVNLREELPPYYRRLGYSEQGILPFPAPERSSQPCHFIVMTKPL